MLQNVRVEKFRLGIWVYYIQNDLAEHTKSAEKTVFDKNVGGLRKVQKQGCTYLYMVVHTCTCCTHLHMVVVTFTWL